MSNNLRFGTSVEIVYATLKQLFPDAKISIEQPVGMILPHEVDRQTLRKGLVARLRDLGIDLELPSIEPHLSVIQMGGDISDWSVMRNLPTIDWLDPRDERYSVYIPSHEPAVGGGHQDRSIISWSALPGKPTTPYPGAKPQRPRPKRGQIE